MEHRGARTGWILGGVGALVWIPVLAGVLLAKGNTMGGALGLGLFVIGIFYLIVFAPWRHGGMPFRRLYLGLVLIILVAAVALLAFWEGGRYLDMRKAYYLVYFLPLLIPVFTFGKKTWTDLHG